MRVLAGVALILCLVAACDREWWIGRQLEDGGQNSSRCGAGDDPDGDFISSQDEGDGDLDADGVPNYLDADSDGDGISDAVEEGDGSCVSVPFDTDRDGAPDFLDVDADDDTILDEEEGDGDSDLDGVADFRDIDSDGDGRPDQEEAGDEDLSTPAGECAAEIDPADGTVRPDGVPDYLDPDSDNDGLSDGDEMNLGTNPCSVDSDGDGFPDIAEGAYESVNCTGGMEPECGCARRDDCGIPEEHFYVILPHRGGSVQRTLRFSTSLRTADVFFLLESARGAEAARQRALRLLQGEGGLVAEIGELIPNVWFGGGQFTDFPFAPYGGGADPVFGRALAASAYRDDMGGVTDVGGRLVSGFEMLGAQEGGDRPTAIAEALYQTIEGEGGRWMFAMTSYELERYVEGCPAGTWGAGCLRDGSLPVIITFTGACAHAGPPGEDLASCAPYSGLVPRPHGWSELVTAMNLRGARFIGLNTSGVDCATSPRDTGAGDGPCFFLRRLATETKSMDRAGAPLVFNVRPEDSDSEVMDQIIGGVTRLTSETPLDVDTVVRDDPAHNIGVDGRAFIRARAPACVSGEAGDVCWIAPDGVDPAEAVASYDSSTFFGVIPGTQVDFELSFENLTVPGGASVRVYIAYVDIRADGAVRLSTRQVYVVVPASSAEIVI